MSILTLGSIPDFSAPLQVSPDSFNQHLLITGKSGSGKTEALKRIEKTIALQGGHVLVLNHSQTHNSLCNDPQTYYIDARTDGIPLSLLTPLTNSNGVPEDIDDICEAVADIFSSVKKLGQHQRYLLSEACRNAIQHHMFQNNDMEALSMALSECTETEGKILNQNFRFLFKKIKFQGSGTLWADGKITLLDLSGFNTSVQILLSELILSVLWREYRMNSQNLPPAWIVCDEFQSLNLKDGSILAQILREGRKFHLSLLLATQTLSTFDTGCRSLLQQAGTKLYFRPSESDIRSISRNIFGIPQEKAQNILCGLKVGECLAEGVFLIGSRSLSRSFKMSFR